MPPFVSRLVCAAFCVAIICLPVAADDTSVPAANITVTTSLYGALDTARPCTGVLIDARHLKDVRRSQSPFLLAADATVSTPDLYPDPKCLPSLTELEENGIVRFYHSVADAQKGFVGDNPYIVRAVKCSGPFAGDLVVSAEDAAILRDLEKKIHYTQTWHVGFLLPDGR